MEEESGDHRAHKLDLTQEKIQVPRHYWEELDQKDPAVLFNNALATAYSREEIALSMLGREILVNRKSCFLSRKKQGGWEPLEYPLLELLVLVYLLHAGSQSPGGKLVSAKELKTAHFFQGPHELSTGRVLRRFGKDLQGFAKAAESVGGERQALADAAYRIPAFPKVPLYYLLWSGDEEFEPRVSVLFDRSIENHLPADALWGLVAFVSELLLKSPHLPF